VHHLAGGPGARRGESRENTDGEKHPSPAEVSDEVERHDRVGSRADRCERSGQGDVVDVMTGGFRQQAVLAPTGHPAVDEPRVAGMALRRADTQPLGDSRPEPFDENVGHLDQAEDHPGGIRALEIRRDRLLASIQRVGVRRPGSLRSVDPHHLRSQIGEDHPAEWRRTDPGQLDDPDSFERAGHQSLTSKSTTRPDAYTAPGAALYAPRLWARRSEDSTGSTAPSAAGSPGWSTRARRTSRPSLAASSNGPTKGDGSAPSPLN